jgi:hypothetical protein
MHCEEKKNKKKVINILEKNILKLNSFFDIKKLIFNLIFFTSLSYKNFPKIQELQLNSS